MWRTDWGGGTGDAAINMGSMETWCEELVIPQVRHAYRPELGQEPWEWSEKRMKWLSTREST